MAVLENAITYSCKDLVHEYTIEGQEINIYMIKANKLDSNMLSNALKIWLLTSP